MKFVIIGSALSGNKGAAAMLESSIQSLRGRVPDAEFTLLSTYPEDDKAQNKYDNLTVLRADPIYLALVVNVLAIIYRLLPPLRPLIRSRSSQLRALTEADALLDQGGITFNDGRELYLLYNIATILPALLVGTKVMKCAQALGPFNNPINRAAARVFLPRMSLIVARGQATFDYLQTLNLKNVVQGADYAFSLKVTEEERLSAQKHVDLTFFASGKTVGVSPSVVVKNKVDGSGGDYTSLMAEFINYLIEEKGYRVALIPHSIRTPNKGGTKQKKQVYEYILPTREEHNTDLSTCQDIYRSIGSKNECLLIEKEIGSQELRYIIGQCDLFVASRFHAMISSLSTCVPTLVIGWSHKYKEVLEMFELESWALGHKELNRDYLRERFSELESQQAAVESSLKKNLPQVIKMAVSQTDEIIRLTTRERTR